MAFYFFKLKLVDILNFRQAAYFAVNLLVFDPKFQLARSTLSNGDSALIEFGQVSG